MQFETKQTNSSYHHSITANRLIEQKNESIYELIQRNNTVQDAFNNKYESFMFESVQR